MTSKKKLSENTRMIFAALRGCAFHISVYAGSRKPIVDIRFNADYSQITNSVGDEWAPTWADDGNLYTGNDDGRSFGGIPSRSVAFGKLTGDDPFHLTSTAISDMAGYGENGLRSEERRVGKEC